MRHILGYLCCLAFVSGVLIYFGMFAGLVRASQARVKDIIAVFALDPGVGPAVSYTLHIGPFSLSPAMALGQVAATMFSTVGLLALIFYLVLSWMMPAR